MPIKSDARENRALDRKRIQKSMRHWENMDMAGRELGRGLGRKELIARVAKEVGKTQETVLSALKRGE